MQKMKLTPISLNIKINSKFVNNINIRVKLIKILEENKAINLYDFEFDNRFLDMTP